ncbi:WD40 repeat domain-containing protein [Nonomuraea sp. NPDC005692]|uniref:WD40 repeat domain-containing protein n=1 Tax=Nonomuraea sp. NPDC005692 TaxID=3157168 RepID=UPI0034009C25
MLRPREHALMEKVVFSPDGRTLAGGGSRGKDARIWFWDLRGRSRTGHPLSPPGRAVHAVAYSPDGRLLLAGGVQGDGDTSSGAVWSWDAASHDRIGDPLLRTGPVSLADMTLSPDGHVLAASGAPRGTVNLWNAATGEQLGTLTADSPDAQTSLAFAPDGRTLAVGAGSEQDGMIGQNIGGTVRLWDIGLQRRIRTYPGFGAVVSPAFGADGRTLAVTRDSTVDGEITVWDTARRRRIGERLAGIPGWPRSLGVSPGGRLFATGSANVNSWNADTRLSSGVDATVEDGGTVRVWRANPWKEEATFTDPRGAVNAVAFSPDGTLLAAGSGGESASRGTSRVWDLRSRKEILSFTEPTGPVKAVAFSPDCRLMAGGSGNVSDSGGTVRVWDVRSRKSLASFSNPSGSVTSLACSPDGRTLATGSRGGGATGSVRLWDVATGKQVGTPLADGIAPVTSVAFSPDGDFLAAGSANTGSVRQWHVATRQQIAYLPFADGWVSSVAFSPAGDMLAAGGDTVRLWRTAAPQDPVAAVCALPGPSLARAEWQQYVPEAEFRPVCPCPRRAGRLGDKMTGRGRRLGHACRPAGSCVSRQGR